MEQDTERLARETAIFLRDGVVKIYNERKTNAQATLFEHQENFRMWSAIHPEPLTDVEKEELAMLENIITYCRKELDDVKSKFRKAITHISTVSDMSFHQLEIWTLK